MVIEILIENLGFGSMLKTSDFPMELFLLIGEDYIKNYKVLDDKKQGVLKIYLKYTENKEPVIEGLKKVSKPSLRNYTKKDDIPQTLNGLGITIVSTSKGVMTDKTAKKENVGGEVVCQVW